MGQNNVSVASVRVEKSIAWLRSVGRTTERHPYLRWGLFLAGAAVLTLPGYFVQDAYALAHFANAPVSSWGAHEFWIQSAECMRKTGAWLALCLPDGRLMPIAGTWGGDDPGHALLLSLLAIVVHRSMAVIDIVRLNIAIDYTGLAAMATILFAARCYVATLVTLVIGVEVYLFGIGVGPHPATIGTATMAAILPLAILLSERGLLSPSAQPVTLAAGGALLGLAALIREPIGMMGLMVSLGALVWLAWRNSSLRRPTRLLALLALVLLAWQTPRWVMLARDMAFNISPTEFLETHGLSHNLYTGLGAVPNGFGIVWDDLEAKKTAQAVDPSVVYLSRRYYGLMWRLYFERLASDPGEVARIYWTKFTLMLDHRLPRNWWPLWTVLPLAIALLWLGTRRNLSVIASFPQGPIFVGVGLGFTGLFVVQGVLGQQGFDYARPIGAFVGVFFAIAVELACRQLAALLARKIPQ